MSRAYDFTGLEWPGSTVHILSAGRAMCSKLPEWKVLGEPPSWALGHWWVGITEGPKRILACPGAKRCGACFLAFVELRRQPSAVQQQINRAAAEARERVAANPTAAGDGPTKRRKRAGDLGPVIGPGARRTKKSPACEQVVGPPGQDSARELLNITGIVPVVLPNVEYGPTLPLTIVGIDPGLRNLGLFVLVLKSSGLTCEHRETFKTAKKHGDTEQRLRAVAQHLRHFMAKWSPRVLGFERLSGVNTGKEMQGAKGHNKDRGPLIEVIGMIKMLALVRGIPAYAVATMSARVAVMGKGKTRGSEKKNVRDAVERLTGATGLTLDQGDAGAIAFGAYCKHRDALNPPARKGVRKPRSKGGHVSRLAAQPARSRKAARKGGGI